MLIINIIPYYIVMFSLTQDIAPIKVQIPNSQFQDFVTHNSFLYWCHTLSPLVTFSLCEVAFSLLPQLDQ